MCVIFSHFFIPGIKKGVELLPCDSRVGLTGALINCFAGAVWQIFALNCLKPSSSSPSSLADAPRLESRQPETKRRERSTHSSH